MCLLVVSNSCSLYSTIWTKVQQQPFGIDADESAFRAEIINKVKFLKYSVLGGSPSRATTSCRAKPISFLLLTRSSAMRRRADAGVWESLRNNESK